ncbi:MAG: geranylgeranylglyceryl/heptaprenylglyceryl phosphate synthase [Candidatus Edwardsbacteria bacterium]
MKSVYTYLLSVIKRKKAGFLVLLDPDRLSGDALLRQAISASESGADGILLGTSLLLGNFLETKILKEIKRKIKIPLILFPGDANQITPLVDAVFFLSLVSGRNPDFLIGEHVKAAPKIKQFNIEPIPVGYILLDSGKLTSVEFMSQTKPIPQDKPEIVKAHALAAQYLGLKFVYLEAGSGAKESVSTKIIKAVKDYTSIPLIVGGGIKTPKEAQEKVVAGANFVVIGNILEKASSFKDFSEFAKAIHK